MNNPFPQFPQTKYACRNLRLLSFLTFPRLYIIDKNEVFRVDYVLDYKNLFFLNGILVSDSMRRLVNAGS